MRVGAAPLGREPRAEHLLEEARPSGDEDGEAEQQQPEGDEEHRAEQQPAVRDREHEEAAREPEQATPRERREVDDREEREQQRQRDAIPVAALEAQVERQEQDDRGSDLDPEVVRVAGQGVHAVHEGALDRAEDVDLARAARDRLQPGLVEVPAGRLGDRQLGEAVRAVRRDPADEGRERHPVEAQPAARDQRDARDEEQEVEEELDHSLRPLSERFRRLEVEPPDEVDEQEGGEEAHRHHGRARHRPVEALEPVDEERDEEHRGDDVRERHRARDLPLQLRERDREDRREEERLDVRRAIHGHARTVDGDRGHGGES